MVSKKCLLTLAAALLVLVCHAVIRAGTDDVRATTQVSSIDASGDDTASIPDFDGDGTIGFGDFVKLAAKFGLSQGDDGYDALFDLNGDAEIGFSDFVLFAQNFGKEAPSSMDRDVLVALYHATDGPNWNDNTHWLGARPLSEWFGVHVHNDTGRVWRLSLNGNNLSGSLSPLAELTGLKLLELGWNSLTSLSERSFAGLDSLLLLQLNDNKLTSLPEGVFDDLVNLEKLILGPNNFVSLPKGLFVGLENLKALSLNGCNVVSDYPAELFAGLVNLRELALSDVGLSALPDGFFAGLANLERLDLRGNPGTPFALSLELQRTDRAMLTAPGPATVRARIRPGAPYPVSASVTVVNGSATAARLAIDAGATESRPITVNQDSGQASSPTHVSLEGVSATPPGFDGFELRPQHLTLFADSDNNAPTVREPVPHHVLQVGGPKATLDIRPYYSDPDGDALAYSVAPAPGNEASAANVEVIDGSIEFTPVMAGRATWTIAATDPQGFRAFQDVGITVLPASDAQTFDIDLVFLDRGTEAHESTIRLAADRWEKVIESDLPDVPLTSELTRGCGSLQVRVHVEQTDDLMIFVQFDAERFAGHAGVCAIRDGSKLPFLAQAYFHPGVSAGSTFMITALHEIGHALGIGTVWGAFGLLENPSSKGIVADTHFSGPLAIKAFDAAGFANYDEGAKVPVENESGVSINSHWRASVLRGELMNPSGGKNYPCCGTHDRNGGTLSAITIQSLADLGYDVDVSQADRYSFDLLRGAAKATADSRTDDASLDFSCNVIERPILVVDEDSRVVRVIEANVASGL